MSNANKKPDYKNAEEQALILLEKLGLKEPPIDPFKIAKELGINIAFVDFKENDILGFYDEEGSNKTIFIKKNDYYLRQRFTVGHELGHFILHREWAKSANYEMLRTDDGFNKNEIELEADAFAANLLVPKKFLEKYINVATIEELSGLFGVSKIVIGKRLQFCNFADEII